MTTKKRFYSYVEEPKAIAFIDILGFSNLSNQFTEDGRSKGELLFTLFENCILPYRNSMKDAYPQFVREVPADESKAGHKHGFWYSEVAPASVNFVYSHDSAVLYSTSLTHLFRELSGIFGACIVWGVPVRAAISIGMVHHSEWIERPGSAICLYGTGLIEAIKLEKKVPGCGMRVLLSEETFKLASTVKSVCHLIQPEGASFKTPQLKWWLQAVNGVRGRAESDELKFQFDRWFTEKQTRHWFKGENMESTKKIISQAVQELITLGR